MNKTTNLFLQLVQIDSPSGHEEKMSQWLQKWLKKHNFTFKVDKVGNIYATNNTPGKPLLLCAHMDTVQPGIGIKPVIKDGIIKSSGNTILGADNKASLAAILTAVETIQLDKNLELLFTVKEETGGGVEFFSFEWIKAKYGIVFDKSGELGGIILASPYISNFHIILTGKAAHSSTPQKGNSAFIPAFKTLPCIPIGLVDGGQTTINIGLLNGGTGINTIPSEFHISGEVRSYSKELFQLHLKNIKDLFEEQSKKTLVKSAFSTDGFCAGYSFQKSDALIKQLSIIYTDLGLSTHYYDQSGISDANILNAHGIKTINLTDGVKNPHTTKERIKVKDLVFLAKIIISCITNL